MSHHHMYMSFNVCVFFVAQLYYITVEKVGLAHNIFWEHFISNQKHLLYCILFVYEAWTCLLMVIASLPTFVAVIWKDYAEVFLVESDGDEKGARLQVGLACPRQIWLCKLLQLPAREKRELRRGQGLTKERRKIVCVERRRWGGAVVRRSIPQEEAQGSLKKWFFTQLTIEVETFFDSPLCNRII